jgi:taurine dioxygenase
MKILRTLDSTNAVELDFNLLTASNEDLKEFVKIIPDHHLILIRNLPTDKSKLVEVINKIGKTFIRPEGLYFTDPEAIEITRVTNARDEQGKKLGLFADLELCWHSNGTLRKDVKQVTLMLYCVKPGDLGYGITGFCNMRKAYEDLPDDVKDLIDSMEVRHSMKAFAGEIPSIGKNDGGYKLTQDDPEYEIFNGSNVNRQGETLYTTEKEEVWKPLVVTHPWHGQKALYFIPSVIVEWRNPKYANFDSNWLWNYLYDHCFQEKYIYQHEWKPGDMIFNDQYYGLHNRNEVRGDRLLWRFCTDNAILNTIN